MFDDFGENYQIEFRVVIWERILLDVEVLINESSVIISVVSKSRYSTFCFLHTIRYADEVIGEAEFKRDESFQQHDREIRICTKLKTLPRNIAGQPPSIDKAAKIVCSVDVHFSLRSIFNAHRSHVFE
jgi:hypothetical protein